jgi:GDSL-like Lipase/Acylhydrolase
MRELRTRTRSFLAGVAGFILVSLTGVSAGRAAPFDAIYTFGDSLTDVGNFLILTSSGSIPGVPPQPLPPHYVTGRRSNGPIWIDYFANDLGLGPVSPSLQGGTDFAEAGGAETGTTPLHQANALDLTGTTGQLAQFRQSIPHPSPNALYTLWIGGNDLYDVFYALGAGGHQTALRWLMRLSPMSWHSSEGSPAWAQRTCCCSRFPTLGRRRRSRNPIRRIRPPLLSWQAITMPACSRRLLLRRRGIR